MALMELDLAAATRMASRNPAEFLGLGNELGRIAPGYRADLVLVDEQIRILDIWIDGRSFAEDAEAAPARSALGG
jgi:N-acetylglucosamine-6-phosphate deacetylase